MAQYQIEAIVEKIEVDSTSGNLYIQLKGCGQYLFKQNRKDKNNDDVYWNIFENVSNPSKSEIEKSGSNIILQIPINKVGLQCLLGHAFCEKKKLRFGLKMKSKLKQTSEEPLPNSKLIHGISKLIITEISHAT
jgi:hypothetical protein